MQTIALHDRVKPDAGVAETTEALQAAIDEGARSGGVVSVSPGNWTITTIHLRSNMTLRLERGSRLLAHPDIDDYPALARGHNKDRQPYHLVYADGCDRLTIEGDGVIDGQGDQFWDAPIGDRTQGAVGLFHRHRGARVSPMVDLRDCTNVVLRDFTMYNSPGWTLHTLRCRNVRIDGVTVDNNLFGPNTDGFDINGCQDVIVSNCNLTCGDDAIILKSTDDAGACERIAITNCVLSTHCAAIGLGAEIDHVIRDVTVSNCVVTRAIRMIQLEMWTAGVFENITINNITGRTMADVPLERPIYLDIQHHRRTDGKLGTLRNVVISNMTAITRGRIMLTAADGACIEDVTLRDIQLIYPEVEDPKHTVQHMHSSQMSNDNPESRDVRSAVILDNVRRVRLENISTRWPDAQPRAIEDGPWPGLHTQLPMHALWCRNARDVVVDCPWLTPSMTDVEPLVQRGSELEVRA